ncbi:MAG: DUF1559 domain-containing protein [Pirellulales bacterium]
MSRLRKRSASKRAFTLVELLVVIVIIGILIGLLIPGIQAARNAARDNSSKNNLRQITLAFNNHYAAKQYFPPSWQSPDVSEMATTEQNVAGWSIMALMLPYLEQKAIASNIDYDLPYNLVGTVTQADGRSVQLSSLRVPTYVSPAEPRDEARLGGTSNPTQQHYPFNYAVNLGTWFVWDPVTKRGGYGAAYPDSKLRDGDFFDGMSYTLAFAEVKAWQPYHRNGNSTSQTDDAPPTLASICSLPNDGTLRDSGHTEWVDGRGHHSGFTTVFTPNERVLCTGTLNSVAGTYDVDWTNHQEGVGLGPGNTSTTDDYPTYIAATSRGYFPGHVNVSMVDGSVRSISDNINIGVWRALSTRSGKEMLPDDITKQ